MIHEMRLSLVVVALGTFPIYSIRRNYTRMSSSPKVHDLHGCFSSEKPTMIMLTLLCGQVLSHLVSGPSRLLPTVGVSWRL